MTDKSKEEALIEVHMDHINNRLDKFDNLFSKLFDRQDEFSRILERNTVIVDEHHKRSTNLETIVNSIKSALEALANKFTLLENDVNKIEADVEPIKAHVKNVDVVFHIWSSVPKVMKFIVLLLTLISSCYGIFTMFKSILGK